MALAIDASTPALASSGNGTVTVTTAAFTTPANVFLLALVGRNGPASSTDDTGTVAGTGLTWALAGRKSAVGSGQIAGGTAQPGLAEVWWAYSAAALTAQTVTDTRTVQINTGYDHTLKVLVITGAETTWGGAIAANGANGSAPTVNLTTTANGSWVFAVVPDWSASGAATVGSGQTLVDDYNNGTQISIHFLRQTTATATSGTSVTSNITAPASEQFNILAVEVRAAGGAAAAAPPRLNVVRQAPMRAANF